jgi:cobaltochelatase CobS
MLIPDAPQGEETLEADEDFRMVAAANTTGRGDEAGLYQGTNILNEAFLNRFGKIFHMEYAPNEQDIMKGRTKCDDRHADLLAEFARGMRVFIEVNKLPITLSTRDLISMAEVVDAWGLKMSVELSWLNRVSPEFQPNVTTSDPWQSLLGAA